MKYMTMIPGKIDSPSTPAELPMNVPLRVTELRMLLIRRRVFDTAKGLRAPSLTPQTPPNARPWRMINEHVTSENNKNRRSWR